MLLITIITRKCKEQKMRTISNDELKLVAGGCECEARRNAWALNGGIAGAAVGAGAILAHMGAYGTVWPGFASASEALLVSTALGFCAGVFGGYTAADLTYTPSTTLVVTHPAKKA
jgi:hypothetical protein